MNLRSISRQDKRKVVKVLEKEKVEKVKFTLRLPINKKQNLEKKANQLGISINSVMMLAIDKFSKT